MSASPRIVLGTCSRGTISLPPGGGISPNGARWIACRLGSFLPVRVLSRVFQKLFLEGLAAAFEAEELQFFSDLVSLNDAKAFASALASLRKTEWVVYAKQPFGDPKQVLAYLAHYTHRIAIANSRLLDLDETHVSFRWKDYRQNGVHKNKVMRIEIAEFIRRFLLHILPSGFHRVRYYGLFANGHRGEKLALCRTLLDVRTAPTDRSNDDDIDPGASDHIDPSVANHEPPPCPCPCCGGRMKVFESFNGPFSRPYHVRRLDAL
jgi:Putative transposase